MLKRNVASQKMGIQLTNAADGTPFTGSATVYITIDAGTQAVGTVGSGAMTHEGRGYHTYAPSQAETNGDLVAWTATGSGAINATCQAYTCYPQTGDAYAIVASGSFGNSALNTLLGTIAGYIDTEVSTLVTELAKVPKSDSTVSLNATVLAAIADAILNRDMSVGTDSGSPTVRTPRQALRFLRNKWSLVGTALTVCKEDDTTTSWTGVVTPAAGADPISGNDPA